MKKRRAIRKKPASALSRWIKRRILYASIPGLIVWVVILRIICSHQQCKIDFDWISRATPGTLVSAAISIVIFGLLPELWSLLMGKSQPQAPANWHTKSQQPQTVKKQTQKNKVVTATLETTSANNAAIQDTVRRALDERKKVDPLAGIKIGSSEVLNRLMLALKNEKGIHIESLLGILGSLAGYACHVAARETLTQFENAKTQNGFVIVQGKDGRTYYYGDAPNKPLTEGPYSVWSLMQGSLHFLGEKNTPDIQSIFSNVAAKVGGDEFGIPDIPPEHRPGDLPINYVRSMWKVLVPIMDNFCDSASDRPVLLSICIQKVLEMGKTTIQPSVAVRLVMECAVPMSKIGPEWLE